MNPSRICRLSMSVSLSVKSKILALSFILSGFDDLGITGTPCCTAQRNRTWKETKKPESYIPKMLFIKHWVGDADPKAHVYVCVFTCAGVRSQFFATSMTTGLVTRSPFPKEEKAWKHTPYSSHTLLSSVWHSRGWNSTWRKKNIVCIKLTFMYIICYLTPFCSRAVYL